MADWIHRNYGVPDIIFNNANITQMGAVDQVETAFWDKSYAVNFKAPLLLAQLFLSGMKERKSGTIVFVSSSGAAPYMGAYEVFKTAQVELSNTLAMELEGSGIFVYTIGPGLVQTETAMRSIKIVAENMGMSTDEFYKMKHQLKLLRGYENDKNKLVDNEQIIISWINDINCFLEDWPQ